MSLFDRPLWAGVPRIRTSGAYGPPVAAGAKLKKRMKKHRADHSNPGGIISEYFRQKNSKVL